MSEKIKPQHLARKAMLYVRQSSTYQVSHNLESQKLQYAMEQRLRQLGWREVEVVDEDLGRSAAGTVARAGFERLVAEVCLGKVGAVAAREVSRFARNSREWQQLVEVCRVVDTVLIDHETVYAPRQSNDRLLLGLKGSLNEYELDLLRQRSLEARREKARRGELIVSAPVGYRKTEDQRLEKDPDRRVQQAIVSVFQKFFAVGSIRQTLLWFLEHSLQLPTHTPRGETIWRVPSYGMLYRLLSNPVYAGAYAYGKTEQTTRYENGGARQSCRRKGSDQWLALIPNSHEGYVSWEEFQQIQKSIGENIRGREQSGAVAKGVGLLAGLLRCRRCGRKLTIRYTGKEHDVLRYACHRGWLDNGQPRCITFGGLPVDEAIAKEVLRVVQPAALEAAVLATEEEARKQDQVLEALRHELEAARYTAQRAQRQYDAADPENRLVADELERRWNLALERVREVEVRIQHHSGNQHDDANTPRPTREEFEILAAELESVWSDAETDARLRKRIVRTLIQELIVDVDATAGEVILVIHWKGGVHTELRLPRRRRGQNSSHTCKEAVDAVTILTRICPDAAIAGVLNRNGLLTGRGNRWTRERVTALRSHHRISPYSLDRRDSDGWLTLTKAATFLGVSSRTLRLAVERGEIQAEHPLADGPWVFNRRALQTEAATKLAERIRSGNKDTAIQTAEQRSFGFSST
ncbi:MAG TPA: recombinase family protein [Terriglobales bacterium]|nr:recombinase family protein [Terriglobales bacterium]